MLVIVCRCVDDQNSTNGVYVNHLKISSSTLLSAGDIVCFGATRYKYMMQHVVGHCEKVGIATEQLGMPCGGHATVEGCV